MPTSNVWNIAIWLGLIDSISYLGISIKLDTMTTEAPEYQMDSSGGDMYSGISCCESGSWWWCSHCHWISQSVHGIE